MTTHLVIMAGGIGSRFWPMSTAQRPKQFIDVLGCGRTLLQLTLDRFEGIVAPQYVWVVTSKQYADIVHEQLPQVPVEHILLEPCRRNTAPCLAYVSWRIKLQDPTANIVVSPADHIVMNVKEFGRVVSAALHFTADSDSIVTLGIHPTRPETGYGYIEADLSVSSSRNREIFPVDHFVEKPDRATAEQYLRRRNFYWNSGLFIFRVTTIVNAFRIYAPKIGGLFEAIATELGTAHEQEAIDALYDKCPSDSIDYAVMEKADEIFVLPSDFGWSDLGTWGSLYEHTQRDGNGNAGIGPSIRFVESHNTIVHTTEERRVVVQGLDGFIVAEKDNTLLICRMDQEQRIRQFSDEEEA